MFEKMQSDHQPRRQPGATPFRHKGRRRLHRSASSRSVQPSVPTRGACRSGCRADCGTCPLRLVRASEWFLAASIISPLRSESRRVQAGNRHSIARMEKTSFCHDPRQNLANTNTLRGCNNQEMRELNGFSPATSWGNVRRVRRLTNGKVK